MMVTLYWVYIVYALFMIFYLGLIKLKICKCIALQGRKECKHKLQLIHQIGVVLVKK